MNAWKTYMRNENWNDSRSTEKHSKEDFLMVQVPQPKMSAWKNVDQKALKMTKHGELLKAFAYAEGQ